MSFGFSVGDFILLTQLACRTVQSARKACGAHDDLVREVNSLHIVLRRVESEVSKSNSILSRTEDDQLDELNKLARHCRKVLRVLASILDKYNALSDEQRSITQLWQRVRFANGEMQDLSKIRSEIATHTQALNLFLNLVSIGSQGKVEEYMNSHGEDLKELRQSLHWIIASMQADSHGEKSILTTYTEDDKDVWKTFRRELIGEGFSHRVLSKHKEAIKKYVLELGERGVLDDTVSSEDYTLNDSPNSINEDSGIHNSKIHEESIYGYATKIPELRHSGSSSESEESSRENELDNNSSPPQGLDEGQRALLNVTSDASQKASDKQRSTFISPVARTMQHSEGLSIQEAAITQNPHDSSLHQDSLRCEFLDVQCCADQSEMVGSTPSESPSATSLLSDEAAPNNTCCKIMDLKTNQFEHHGGPSSDCSTSEPISHADIGSPERSHSPTRLSYTKEHCRSTSSLPFSTKHPNTRTAIEDITDEDFVVGSHPNCIVAFEESQAEAGCQEELEDPRQNLRYIASETISRTSSPTKEDSSMTAWLTHDSCSQIEGEETSASPLANSLSSDVEDFASAKMENIDPRTRHDGKLEHHPILSEKVYEHDSEANEDSETEEVLPCLYQYQARLTEDNLLTYQNSLPDKLIPSNFLKRNRNACGECQDAHREYHRKPTWQEDWQYLINVVAKFPKTPSDLSCEAPESRSASEHEQQPPESFPTLVEATDYKLRRLGKLIGYLINPQEVSWGDIPYKFRLIIISGLSLISRYNTHFWSTQLGHIETCSNQSTNYARAI